MDLRTCKTVTRILYVACIALLMAAVAYKAGTVFYCLLGAAMAVAVVLIVFRLKFWRCPKCGAVLPKSGAVRCQQCGWALPDKENTL